MSEPDKVAEWCERDHGRALHPADHDAIESTRALRELIVASILGHAPDRDLYSACALLGRMIAERGGSPTLAASTVDGAREALRPEDHAWVVPARAALAEGFAAARSEIARKEAAQAWEYPRCAVVLESGVVAIAAGYPESDLDALGQWASRVAHDAALAGARRAIVAGTERAREALTDALTLVGVKVETSPPSPPRPWRLFRR